MAAADDILNATQMANKIKDSINEQLKEKMQRIDEVNEAIVDLKAQLEDAISKGLKSQQDRIQATIGAEMKKLDKMKKSVEEWAEKQRQAAEDWLNAQIDKAKKKEEEVIEATNKAIQEDLKKRAELKAKLLAEAEPPAPLPVDP